MKSKMEKGKIGIGNQESMEKLNPVLLDLGNMKILESATEPVEYIVIKIGDETYSTKDIKTSELQLVDTKNVGRQRNLWIKGNFTENEKENHENIAISIPFELNVYIKEKCQ